MDFVEEGVVTQIVVRILEELRISPIEVDECENHKHIAAGYLDMETAQRISGGAEKARRTEWILASGFPELFVFYRVYPMDYGVDCDFTQSGRYW